VRPATLLAAFSQGTAEGMLFAVALAVGTLFTALLAGNRLRSPGERWPPGLGRPALADDQELVAVTKKSWFQALVAYQPSMSAPQL